jgi:fermentation-respiration switch protein FrsA (DUF1100 family)
LAFSVGYHPDRSVNAARVVSGSTQARSGASSRPVVALLLFHRTADPAIPIATSQALARLRPDLVTFVPVAGAGHVKSWNHDRAGYEQVAGAFLDRVAATG